MATPTGRPTRVRYGVLGFLCALAFVLYIDRICISKAATDIERDLGISHTAMGFIFGAFTVAYGLFEVPTGRWGDRFGSRGVLVRIVLWWSAFTVLTAAVWRFSLDSGYRIPLGSDVALPLVFDSFLLMILIRFLFGAGEAGALPNMARVIARWFPADARGPAQGYVNTAMLIGGAVTPTVAAYLIHVVGWRWSFVSFGSLGVIWAAAFFAWFRDDPAEHPGVNEAERQLLARSSPGPAVHPPVPWRRVLASRDVWLLGGVITCSAFASYLYFFWYPTYLEQGRGLGRILSGWLASLVLAGGAVGAALGGYLSDGLAGYLGDRRRSRQLIGAGGLGFAALMLLAGVRCDDAVAAAGLTALASLSAAATLPSWWAAVTTISGKHLGALFGLMNSMGVPGAVSSQLFVGRFADWRRDLGYEGRAQWDPAFYVYVGVLLVGAIGWLFIDGTHSVVEPAAEKPTP
jgi:MFS family permease